MLKEKQQDALKEFMNISIGEAANLLSDMLNKKIKLKIPKVKLISLDDNKLNDKFRLRVTSSDGHVVSTSIEFGKEFAGEARLIFPADKSKVLVDLCLGEESDLTRKDMSDLTDADFDVIREIGNIILNAIVGGLGNLLETKIKYDLPEVNLAALSEVENEIEYDNKSYLLIIYNNFNVNQTKIKGSILLILSMDSIENLLNKIDEIVSDIYDE